MNQNRAGRIHALAGRTVAARPGEPDGRRGGLERRDLSAQGIARRARFDASLEVLRSLGLSVDAVEYYRHLARTARTLPHELVRDLAEAAAAEPGILALTGAANGHPA